MKSKSDNSAVPTDLLSELAPLAEALNSESNGLNETIELVNKKLGAFNLGIEAFCEGKFDVEFGYGLSEDKWQLVTQVKDADDSNCYLVRPLLKESREVRIEGLSLLGAILKEIKAEAKQKITQIREAKQIAAAL